MVDFDYRVDSRIFAQFPGYELGVLVFDGLHNSEDDPALQALMRAAEASARTLVPANIVDMPQIAAWRSAYRRFGAKPAEHRSSIEAMLRRVAKHDQLPAINALVDIGNIVSLRYLLPAGVHPLRDFKSPVALRGAQENDGFVPADGAPMERVPDGEVVLAAGCEVLTRRWTWRQAASTRTLPATQRVFFNVDGLRPTSRAEIESAMHDIEGLVSKFCGGSLLARSILTADNPRLALHAAG